MKKRVRDNQAIPKLMRGATAVVLTGVLAFVPAMPAFALSDAAGRDASVSGEGSPATDLTHASEAPADAGGGAALENATPAGGATSVDEAASAVSVGEDPAGADASASTPADEAETTTGARMLMMTVTSADAAVAPSANTSTTGTAAASDVNAADGGDSTSALPPEVNTVDTRPDNITINLFDYPDDPERQSVNAYNDFIFKFPIEDLRWMNGYVNGAAIQGIVQNRLGADGYPVLNLGLEPGKTDAKPRSLAYLFDPECVLAGKRSFADVSHLFTQDSKGYYSYDSDTNYAYYGSDEGGGDFVVYDGTHPGYRPSKNVTIPAVGFFPFDEYDPTKTNIDPTGPYNHHLGLTMTSTFEMPEGGRLNGDDMKFEFSGDDDTWVFVDGVLVLDIGGIHGARTGSINFATGDVNVDSVAAAPAWRPIIGPNSTLKEIFANQGLEWDGSTGKRHTVSFFYLERGNMQSNLKLEFNTANIWNVAGHKTWDDNDNASGSRPDSIDIHLLKNGSEIASRTVTEQDGWSWSFDGLPKYENGKLVDYSILEGLVPGYASKVMGYDVINTLIPGEPGDPTEPGNPPSPADSGSSEPLQPVHAQGGEPGVAQTLPTTGDSALPYAVLALVAASFAGVLVAVWRMRKSDR